MGEKRADTVFVVHEAQQVRRTVIRMRTLHLAPAVVLLACAQWMPVLHGAVRWAAIGVCCGQRHQRTAGGRTSSRVVGDDR